MLATGILLLGPLFIVPLGWQLLKQAEVVRVTPDYRRAVAISWAIAVVALAGSFTQPSGTLAALLATPWLLITLTLAALGARFLVREVRDFDASLALAAALLLLAVGGSWTLMSRAGLQPWNFSEQKPFSDQIVLLTGVHFHYAGFALPILTGWTIRELNRPSGAVHIWSTHSGIAIRRFLVATVVSGVPLVGLGITFSPLLEVIASGLLTLSTLLLAIMQFQVALRPAQTRRRGLLLISSVCLICGMTLAMTYALGEYLGSKWIDIPTMIPLHGIANSIGFSLSGLLAWNLTSSSPAAVESSEADPSAVDDT